MNISEHRRQELQPDRISYAIRKIEELGMQIIFKNETEIQFIYKGSKINLFPYTGWHTGKSIKDGRGIKNLLKQLK